jgi:FG-GAP-like repeat
MNDIPARSAKTALWLLALAGGGLIAAAGAALFFYKLATEFPRPTISTTVADKELDAHVHEFCGHCHAFPPPETFPRSAWKYEVEQGYGFFELYSPPLHAPPIDVVVKYFQDRAPKKLPPAAIERASTSLPVRFEPTPFPGPPDLDVPIISNVNLVHLYDDRRLDVLATDMAHGLVMVLQPYVPKPSWKVLARLKDPDHPDQDGHPAHTQVVDLDGDGIKDILVADLGSFPPTDRRVGRVVWLRGERDGTFTPFTLLKDVGRVADVEAADFRGVGKLDLVVGVFGLQKEGDIRYLENHSPDRDHPKFESHILDDRHGTIHVPVCDLHGDGRKDFVALISQEHETVVAFLNDGKGNFNKETIYTASHPAYGSSGIEVVDLNNDGLPDVLYTNGDVLDKPYLLKPYHSVQWLENPGKGRFPWVHHPLTPMYGVHRAVAADLCGDGRMDVAAVCFLPEVGFPDRADLKPDAFIVLQQTAPGRFARHALETASCDHVTCAAGDLYGTGRMDVVVGNFGPGKDAPAITIWKNMGRPAARQEFEGEGFTALAKGEGWTDLFAPLGGGRRLCPRLLAPDSIPPARREPAGNAGPRSEY